jgi:MSHA biogenesis protein MshK
MLGFVVPLAVGAQVAGLVDPTRPPVVSSAEAKGEAVVAGPRLQSVLISPARRIAVISGKTLALGEKYGDATVVSITETTVRLRSANEVQTLHLFPEVARSDRRAGAKGKQEKGFSR